MEDQVDYLVGEDESEGEDKEMTNDKAIVIIDNEKPHCGRRVTFTEEEKCEAFEMAIEALRLIPDNATNGDVIKALFPEIITTDFCMTVHATTKVESGGVKGGISFDFWKEWWYAPYKKEGE